MNERLYKDVDGSLLSRSLVNSHHVFPRCRAKGKGQTTRKFINQHGLLVPIVKEAHQELHADLDFPIIPTPSLIHRINMAISNMPEQNPYDRFISITETFERYASRCPNSDHRRQSGRIFDNLSQQAPYILMGQVKIIEIEE